MGWASVIGRNLPLVILVYNVKTSAAETIRKIAYLSLGNSAQWNQGDFIEEGGWLA
jgi:hypothetical protein